MTIDKTQTYGMQTREPREVATAREATRPGVLLTPPVDIFEDSNALTMLADMPGVKPEDLTIDLHDGVLTIAGHADVPETPNEVDVLQEYRPGTFQRSFILSETIDQGQIQATLKHGVLRLRLPKVEQARPRQIKIQTD
jgi:HSP20 family protein